MRNPKLHPSWTKIDPQAFVAKNATVIGDVHVGPEASLWYGVVARGDVEAIRVGARSNIQDNSVLHADKGFPCQIGEGVTVGHRCTVHGATLGDHVLVGMGATVMNGAEIGAESLVGAGALIPEGKKFPPRSLIVGMPGKLIRSLSEEEVQGLHRSAAHYVENGKDHAEAGLGSDLSSQ